MRDGVTLSAMIRFPDPVLYGTGPFPTVVEYSGYSPSNPERTDTPARIAGAMGYATVSVNMRGTGCSGGVFDFFNRAQQADGYDIIETVARQPWVLHNHGYGRPSVFNGCRNPPSSSCLSADAWFGAFTTGIYKAMGRCERQQRAPEYKLGLTTTTAMKSVNKSDGLWI